MKAYTNLTVVMRCQIVAKKSVAPSSGEVGLRARSGNYFFQKIYTPVPRPRPELRECVTSMIFQGLLVFFAWRAWQGIPLLKISLSFFCFQKIFFSETSWWGIYDALRNHPGPQELLLGIFTNIGKNFAETLHFEDLAVANFSFFYYVHILVTKKS